MESIAQYKTLDDLREMIKALEGMMARPVIRGSHPTIYPDVGDGPYRTFKGVRMIDYQFSFDKKWVLAHRQKGLSFSSNWRELKRVHRMFSRVKTRNIDVHWVLQGADLPDDMAFVEDDNPKKKGHYFWTVKKDMSIYRLVDNLNWMADRMSVIKNSERAL